MILIYDFDGTLTPYSLPQYDILRNNGYDDQKIMKLVHNIMDSEKKTLYQAYFIAYQNILNELCIDMSDNNICLGANRTKFNEGINEYFNFISNKFNNVKHYVITSGFKVYVENTPIAKYFTNIYGTTFNYENGIATNVDKLVDEIEKVKIIKQISSNCNYTDNIIYMGDGLTDKPAFEYVKKVGGKSILLCKNKDTNETYINLKEKNVLNECFEPCFKTNSNLCKYITKLIKSNFTK